MTSSVSDGSRPRVVVLDDHEGAMAGAAPLRALADRVDLTTLRETVRGEELRAALGGVPIVVAIRERTPLDAGTLSQLPDTELILQTGGHAYHVDTDAATQAGIAVSLGRGSRAPTPVVAEMTLGLVVDWFRGLTPAIVGMREGRWPAALGRSLHGCSLGVLGLGRHGVSVARLAQAFGMDVQAWGPTLTPERAAEHGVRAVGLEELLSTADVVSIHLRLSDTSRGLIGREQLRLLRSDALLVNTSRGPIVDEEALVTALRERWFGGAALDVFNEEPLPSDHPLRSLDNVLLTPHLGYTVDVAFGDFAATTATQLAAYLDQRLEVGHLLNPEVLAQSRPRCGGVAPVSSPESGP